MSRSLSDFSPGERNAYVVWNQKLADRTLPKAEHDLARSELDKLFRRGPFAELHLLKDELQSIKDRLSVLEEYVLTPKTTVDLHPTTAPEPKVVRADASNKTAPAQSVTPSVEVIEEKADGEVVPAPTVDEPAKDGRGRKPLRFHPEKDANKTWHVLDREANAWTSHGPYKTRREAKEMADTLNNMPTAPPVPIAGPLTDGPKPVIPENVTDGIDPPITETAEGNITPDPFGF